MASFSASIFLASSLDVNHLAGFFDPELRAVCANKFRVNCLGLTSVHIQKPVGSLQISFGWRRSSPVPNCDR